MEKRPENLGEPKSGGITGALKTLEQHLKSAIVRAKTKEDKSFGEYIQTEGQENIEAKWQTKLELAEKDLAEFREKARKYAESKDPIDRESYSLHIKLKEEDIKQLKKTARALKTSDECPRVYVFNLLFLRRRRYLQLLLMFQQPQYQALRR